jgi:hypothetical protein
MPAFFNSEKNVINADQNLMLDWPSTDEQKTLIEIKSGEVMIPIKVVKLANYLTLMGALYFLLMPYMNVNHCHFVSSF